MQLHFLRLTMDVRATICPAYPQAFLLPNPAKTFSHSRCALECLLRSDLTVCPRLAHGDSTEILCCCFELLSLDRDALGVFSVGEIAFEPVVLRELQTDWPRNHL